MKKTITQLALKSLLVLAAFASFPTSANYELRWNHTAEDGLVRLNLFNKDKKCERVHQRLQHDANGYITGITHYYICPDFKSYRLHFPLER